MRFRLIEGLVRDMRKYYEDIPETTFQLLVACDPTNRNMDKDFDNWVAGKYVKWILQKYQKGWFSTDEQQLNNITDMLAEFDRLKAHMPSQDINFYKSFDEIYDSIEKAKELEQRYIPSDKASMRAEKANASNDALEIVYQNDSFKVYWPKTYPQSREVGRGSSWCTASSEPSYFNEYNKQGPLRTIHLNDKPFAQYHIPSRSFLDADDRDFEWKDFFAVAPAKDVKGLKDFIQSEYDSYDGKFTNVYGIDGHLEDRLNEFPSDEELAQMEKVGNQLAEELRDELVLIVDAFNTQDFINWAYDYLKKHASSTRLWQSFARHYAFGELTRYKLFSQYMGYDKELMAEYDGCFALRESDGVVPNLSGDEVRQFNLSLKDTISHTLFGIFPVSPYLQNIDYTELKYVPSALYWARNIEGTDAYRLPTNVFRFYVRDEDDVIDSIPRSMLRNRKYRFISVADFEEAVDKELAYQTKVANEQQGIHESLEEKLSDVRHLLDRSKRLNNPEIFNQLGKGDFLYNPISNSFLYIVDVSGDNIKTIPAGSDLTLYHDNRPTIHNQSSLKNYFLLGNKAEISEIESDLIDKFNYDNYLDALDVDDDFMRKWQKSNGYYTYQDRALDDSDEEVDSDSTDVFVKNDRVEVNLQNGESIYGKVCNGQWALDFGDTLKLKPLDSNSWDKISTEINPEDIDNVHIIKFNNEPNMYSGINLNRFISGLNGETLQLDGYIFKDKDSDGIKFYFPDVPSLGKSIGILSAINEFEEALKAVLVRDYKFKNTSFNVNTNIGNDIISRRNNQVVKEFTVELIPEVNTNDESINDLIEYIGSSDYAANYYKKLLIKVLPSNIVTIRHSDLLCAKLNFVRKYTFANLTELNEYITTLLPEWMRGIDLFDTGYSTPSSVRIPQEIDDDEVFRNNMSVDGDYGTSGNSALELINNFLKRYHGRFTFQIILGRNSKQRKQIIKKLFEAYPEIEEKLYNHILNN